MGLIDFYIIFALTTGLVTMYELVCPVLNSLKLTHPELNIIRYYKTTVTTFFMFSVLVAPLVIVPCLWPSRGERFRKALHSNLITTE